MIGLGIALLLASPAPAPAPATDGSGLFERVLRRALASARAELVASRELHVDHSTWADPWIATSAHYEVRTTQGYHVAARIARDLEYMLAQFHAVLGTDWAPREPLPIWILPTLQDYNQIGQSADEHSSFFGSYYAADQPGRPVATYHTRNQTLLGMWITHSATHQFLEEAFGASPPTWVSEGLASYFSLYWDWPWGARKLKELVKTRRYVSVASLVGAPLSAYTQDADERLVVLGMFFKYLLHHHPDTRLGAEGEVEADTAFAPYLRELVGGRSGRDLGFHALLSEDLGLLEAEFRGFDFGG